MKFTLSVTLGNEAMQSGEDIAQALRSVADKLEALGGDPIEDMDDYDRSGRIADGNGNTVGRWSL